MSHSPQVLKRPFRSPIVVEWNGMQLRLTDLCRHYKIAAHSVHKRLACGWTLTQALLTPPRCCRFCFEEGRVTRP